MSDRGNTLQRLDERRRVVRHVGPAPEPRATERRRANASGVDSAAVVAGYVADMTAQLESMARAAGLDMLAYFLAMARAEANTPRRAAAEAGDRARHS